VCEWLPDYYFFETGEIYKRCIQPQSNRFVALRNQDGILYLRHHTKEKEHMYQVAKLMILLFRPAPNITDYQSMINYDVIHLDEDRANCHINNICLKKKQKAHDIRLQNQENRVALLHQKIHDYVNAMNGKLQCDVALCKDVTFEVVYTCACGHLKRKRLSDCDAKRVCRTCKSTSLTDEQMQKFEDPTTGESFLPFAYGYAGSLGTILNKDKHPVAINKGTVKLCGHQLNAARIIARTFEIPFHHLLPDIICDSDNNNASQKAVVFQEDTSIGIRPDNLKVGIANQNLTPNEITPDDLSDIIIKDNIRYRMVKNLLISETGQVVNVKTNQQLGSQDMYGYLTVLIDNKRHRIHRLVAFLFKPIDGKKNLTDYKKLHVDHIDRDKTNNHINNLRWVTAEENMQHAAASHTFPGHQPVMQYKLINGQKGEFIAKHLNIKAAAEASGMSKNLISRSCHGRTVQRGFFWEFMK